MLLTDATLSAFNLHAHCFFLLKNAFILVESSDYKSNEGEVSNNAEEVAKEDDE